MNKQTIVEYKGRRGVLCPPLPGMLNCNGPNEVSVVFEGTTVAEGTDRDELKVIGPENAKADLHACGAGRGAECCRFLVVGPDGPECQRFGDLRWTLVFKTMVADRDPPEPYPACQIFRDCDDALETGDVRGSDPATAIAELLAALEATCERLLLIGKHRRVKFDKALAQARAAIAKARGQESGDG